jgi:hypothetical protein
MRIRLLLLVALTLVLSFTIAAPALAQAESVPAFEHEPSVAVKWMELLYDRVEEEAISAPAASRLYAYAGVTVYQAVLPGIPENFSLSGQLTGLEDIPYPEEGVYDWPSSANGALYVVLKGVLPETSAQSLSALYQSQITARENEVDAEIVERSLAYGEEVGTLILDWVADDNFATTRDLEYELPADDDSFWVFTNPNMRSVEPYWGTIRPFALYSADACDRPLRLEFSAEEGSTFYQQAVEVMEVGNNLTPEQEEIALFWVDTPGETGTPAGHWVLIQNQLVDQLDLSLGRAAEMYALVGIALGDSFISAWNLKYRINLLRPETYIKAYIDENWNPLVASPGFPEYPSGHSVVSGAAAEVLTNMFGDVAFTDRSGRANGFDDHSFTSFHHAASQAAISRIYGGIHFRSAIENGLRQGQCIGQYIQDYVQLRSRPQGE